MNLGFMTCAIFGLFMLVISLFFALLKEKGAFFISGFNSLSKETRKLYNKRKMSKDMMVLFFQLAVILFAGALLSLLNPYLSSIGFIGWLVLFFKNVHLDSEAAFDKYKIQ